MDYATFAAKRQFIDTPSGRIAYVERGSGPAALFLHGILLNGYLWRHQLAGLGGMRRCIALDLLAHGATEIEPDQDVSYDAQAEMLAQFLDALDIGKIDLVANDSATAIAQIFAANHPDRIRSLTLTDGDTHDNWPPDAFKDFLTLATKGGLRKALETMLANKAVFRSEKGLGLGYERAEDVADDTIEAYLRPFLSSPQRLRDLERFCAGAFHNEQTRRIEPKLRALDAPTLVAWGTDDVFFDVRWADWLAKTIPGTRRKVVLDGARLYFPEERWKQFNAELQSHWREAA
jgi:pimeloyl-ACP methyl ester carboxylesterase